MIAEQEDLVRRLRVLLAEERVVREVSMFGGRSFMVNEKLIISALKNGGLLVRVNADHHQQHLRRPGAMQAEMGAGRQMGLGWIEVAADAIAEDEPLAEWVRIAMDRC